MTLTLTILNYDKSYIYYTFNISTLQIMLFNDLLKPMAYWQKIGKKHFKVNVFKERTYNIV